MGSAIQKLKLLYLADIFKQETDKEHGLTGPQLIERLAERGIAVERKTLYKDIALLKTYGYDIQKYPRRPVEYALASRKFEDGELLLLADAVQSSKFITRRKANALVDSIGELGSKYLANSLTKRIHVEGRIKNQSESVFYNVDPIQQALAQKRKIEFKYFKYDEKKQRIPQHDGAYYCETPVQLIYMDNCYYLIVWNDKHADFATYRVDRMEKIRVSEEPATKNEQIATFDVGQYEQRIFGMYKDDPVKVRLHVSAEAMSSVIDRFGKDVDINSAEEGWANVYVTVMPSPVFFGWLAQFGCTVTLDYPQDTKQEYLDYLQSILDAYKD